MFRKGGQLIESLVNNIKYQISQVSNNEYKKAKSILSSQDKIDFQIKENEDAINKLIIYHSQYINAIQCINQDKNINRKYEVAEIRKFNINEEIPNDEKKVMMDYIRYKLPEFAECSKPGIDHNGNSANIWQYYNKLGRNNNEEAGGIYGMLINEMLNGIASMRPAYRYKDALEMSMYLSEFMRNKKIGEKWINNLQRRCFLGIQFPLDLIFYTYLQSNDVAKYILNDKIKFKYEGEMEYDGKKFSFGSKSRTEYMNEAVQNGNPYKCIEEGCRTENKISNTENQPNNEDKTLNSLTSMCVKSNNNTIIRI